jgi:hypothetical protein
MSDIRARPVGVWIIAAALLYSALSGTFLLVQELFTDSLFPPLPVLGSGTTVVIAHWCTGLMCGSFLLAGIALLLARRIAVPLFVAGLVFYAGYITSAFLIFFFRAAWHGAHGGELLLSGLFTATGGFVLLVAWFVFNYLTRLSKGGVLR